VKVLKFGLVALMFFTLGLLSSLYVFDRKSSNYAAEIYSSIVNRDVAILNNYRKGDGVVLEEEMALSIFELVNLIGLNIKNTNYVSPGVESSLQLAFDSVALLRNPGGVSKDKGKDVSGISFILDEGFVE